MEPAGRGGWRGATGLPVDVRSLRSPDGPLAGPSALLRAGGSDTVPDVAPPKEEARVREGPRARHLEERMAPKRLGARHGGGSAACHPTYPDAVDDPRGGARSEPGATVGASGLLGRTARPG